MASVTERIAEIQQPYGGYLPLKMFERVAFDDGITLNASENVSYAVLVAGAVEYLTRFKFSSPEEKFSKRIIDAFSVSLSGAAVAQEYYGQKGAVDVFKKLMESMLCSKDISGVIINALKLVTFDVWYRNPSQGVPDLWEVVNPDKATIENIITMLKRSASFFREQGGITASGFTFEPDGYTLTVDKGDGDFLTADTLWDMKVYRPSTKIDKDCTLQVLMYWIMGQHSGQETFKPITRIGFFNPRRNMAYILEVSKIPAEVIREVERDVICYED